MNRFLPFLFFKFRFKNAVFSYNKKRFRSIHNKREGKGTLVCKKNIAKHVVVCWKRTV